MLRVTRGRGLLHRLLGWLASFPAAGDAVTIDLAVHVEGERERWVRHFDGKRLESDQWQEGELCAERSGGSTFATNLRKTAVDSPAGAPSPRRAGPYR